MDENDFIARNWLAAVKELAIGRQSINWEITLQLAKLFDDAAQERDHQRLLEINNLLVDSVEILKQENKTK